MAHADVEIGHVGPFRPAGDFGELAEEREACGVLAGLVLAETGLEKRLVVKLQHLRRLFFPGHRRKQAGQQHEVPEGFLGVALFEEMLAHGHVGHVGEEGPLVVAHHGVQHREAALVLLVFHELDRLVVEVLRLAVDVRRGACPRLGGGSRGLLRHRE